MHDTLGDANLIQLQIWTMKRYCMWEIPDAACYEYAHRVENNAAKQNFKG